MTEKEETALTLFSLILDLAGILVVGQLVEATVKDLLNKERP